MTKTFDQFTEGKNKILKYWFKERIIESKEDKIIVQCKNGLYLMYQYISLPKELLGMQFATMMHDKVCFMVTNDLNSKSWRNISREINGMVEITNPKIKEVIEELAKWLGIGKALYGELK